ncbi:MAG: molecular chaperone HtpG, partial [Paludibacteraceae bacterium]|nr:molecular chaperone HtpG [Paludibacteraceae bacterium]
AKKWDDIKMFIQFGMLTDEKFYEKAVGFALLKNIAGEYLPLAEYKEKVKAAQTDKDGNLVLLYTNDPDAHYTYIERAKEKGYDVLLMDGELDVHCMSQAESKVESQKLKDDGDKPQALRFVRIDSDTIENLIRKEEAAKDSYSDDQKEGLRKAFEALLPAAEDKLRYFVTCEAAAKDALPVFLTQNEFMRRMKEMAAHQQGMSFYGQMPDQYNLVINTSHPLIQELVGKETSEEVQEEVERKGEKEGDAPTKETVIKTVYKLEGEDERLKQLIDIALLASGQLKGEALAKFVNRSVELL